MLSFKALKALGTVDTMSVGRDSLLRGMVAVPLGMAAAARWLFPPAITRVAALLPFDLQALYPRLMSYVLLLLPAAICGMVVGFLLLDQRDDRTLMALEVTPLPLASYLAYRLAAPVLLSFVMALITLPLSGLVDPSPLYVLLLALDAAPLAPLTALFLGAFAANKVQGFAIQKALGVFLLAPFIAALVPMPWRLIAGLVPTFWPAALLEAVPAGSGHAWILFLAGLAYQGLLLLLLLRRFQRVVHR